MSETKRQRSTGSWLAVTGIVLGVVGVVAGLVIGIAFLVTALTSRDPGPAQVDVSWQCTEFGDRLYWPTNASRLTFTAVPGGCR